MCERNGEEKKHLFLDKYFIFRGQGFDHNTALDKAAEAVRKARMVIVKPIH